MRQLHTASWGRASVIDKPPPLDQATNDACGGIADLGFSQIDPVKLLNMLDLTTERLPGVVRKAGRLVERPCFCQKLGDTLGEHVFFHRIHPF